MGFKKWGSKNRTFPRHQLADVRGFFNFKKSIYRVVGLYPILTDYALTELSVYKSFFYFLKLKAL